MALIDPETLAKVVEQAGGWEKLLTDYRQLLTSSLSPRAIQAEKLGHGSPEYQHYVYLRGFNGGLEQAEMLLRKVLKEPLSTPEPARMLPVRYASEFGPHRLTKVNDDGEWFYFTEENRHV